MATTTTNTREPFPTDPETFDADERISFSKTADTHVLEDADGSEWEWLARASKWVPVVRNLRSCSPNLHQAGAGWPALTPSMSGRAPLLTTGPHLDE